ncbi:MAG: alpha-L-fucosidase [Clostridia bacterium]|nr:alpha-L-fucosidase [Clostridia bacterium]
MKKRKDSFFGLHFDYHAQPKYGEQGGTLREEDIREICRSLNPDFIQIDCKGHPGWASYPTKLGNAMPAFARDTLALWRKVTREEGVALYMHYSGVYEIKYTSEHPEHTVMKADGTLARGVTRTDGAYVDELMIPQLTELAQVYGVDGVWVDGDCWKATADFHPETLANFEKETGIDLGGVLPATPDDPYYEEYREYNRELFRRYLRHYVDVMHERFPDFQITSNWAFSDHMPEAVTANVDFLSGDLNPKNSFHSARYAARALAQQGMPWDLMSWNFRRAVGNRGAVVAKHPTQIMQEAAAVIAMGGAYQNYVMQYFDGSPNMTDLKTLEPLAAFLRARQPYCFRGTPLHQAALLLSTYDRHQESKNLYSRSGYERVMGMSALLCDLGQSLEIVCEHTLEKTREEFGMIVVPELYRGLAENTVKELLDYARAGGSLVLAGGNTCALFARSGAPFAVRPLNEFFGEGEMAYDNGGDTGHRDTSTQVHKPYYFTMDEKSFGIAFSPVAIEAEEGKTEAWVSDALLGARSPLAVTLPFGKGSITAIGFDIGTQYIKGTQYMQRDLMKQITSALYSPMVRLDGACGRLEIVAMNKDGRTMIQLVNAGGSHADELCATDDLLPPVLDIQLSIALPREPKEILLQPEGTPVPFTYRDGRCALRVDRVEIHSILEIRE